MSAKVLWIRHGESEANAGLPTPDVWSTPLTAAGWEQARAIAAGMDLRPRLIVHSCMERARQTARAAAERWPGARLEEWPVQEFTFLSGAAYAHTTQEQRDEGVRRYWERMDPDGCDGPGAESFAGFIGRVDETLARLRGVVGRAPGDGPVCVFTHGRFIRGVLLRVREFASQGGCGAMQCAVAPADEPMEVVMRRALQMMTAVSVPNGVVWEMELGLSLIHI